MPLLEQLPVALGGTRQQAGHDQGVGQVLAPGLVEAQDGIDPLAAVAYGQANGGLPGLAWFTPSETPCFALH